MKKLTAVEFLELEIRLQVSNSDKLIPLFKQANKLFEEQIIDSCDYGIKLYINDAITGQDYYDATFNQATIMNKEEPKTNLDRLPFTELVKELSEYYNAVSLIEEPKPETIEEAADRLYPESSISRKVFTRGAKWQAERSYSEEDMISFATFYFTHQGKATEFLGKDLFEEWKRLKLNKKK